jgi:cell division protein FtsQ
LGKISVKMIKTKHSVYFIDEKDIRDIVKKSNPSKRIGDINIPKLEKKLNLFPEIDSANVYLNLNGNLNLEIKQRVPVFRLNNGEKNFYVDEKGVEFPISKDYSFPCILVTGDVKKSEYEKLVRLIEKINNDDFSKKYFIGISKENENYELLTNEGNYMVEIGDLDNIELKVKGFKIFVEKYLIYQQPEKYKKVSVKYNNQIVTTLNPNFKENDSVIAIAKKELAKLPIIAQKKETTEKKLNEASIKKEAKPTGKKIEIETKEKSKITVANNKKTDNLPKSTVKKEPTPTKKEETKNKKIPEIISKTKIKIE